MAFAADDIIDSYRDAPDAEKKDRLANKIRLYRPEITAISEFFLDEKNQALAGAISAKIFLWIGNLCKGQSHNTKPILN